MTSASTGPLPPIYRRRVGDIVVTALSDGYLDVPYDVMRDISAQEAEQILAREFQQAPPRVSVNAYLVRAGSRIGLIETGSGNSMGPTLGRLPRMLAAAGVDPGDIDTVLLTHMHPDHSNGLSDEAGKAIFHKAEIRVHADDVAHWLDDARMAQANERQKTRYFKAARQQLAVYKDQLHTFRSGEVFPGVSSVPIPGHTPGHTAYLIASGGEALLLWGDTVHIPEVQFARPEVTMVFDSDPAAAAQTRRRAFEMASSERYLVAGTHLHFPGFAHLAKWSGGYRLVPEPWVLEA